MTEVRGREYLLDKRCWEQGLLRLHDAPRAAPETRDAAAWVRAYGGMVSYESAIDAAGYEREAEMDAPGAPVTVQMGDVDENGTLRFAWYRQTLSADQANLYRAHGMLGPDEVVKIDAKMAGIDGDRPAAMAAIADVLADLDATLEISFGVTPERESLQYDMVLNMFPPENAMSRNMIHSLGSGVLACPESLERVAGDLGRQMVDAALEGSSLAPGTGGTLRFEQTAGGFLSVIDTAAERSFTCAVRAEHLEVVPHLERDFDSFCRHDLVERFGFRLTPVATFRAEADPGLVTRAELHIFGPEPDAWVLWDPISADIGFMVTGESQEDLRAIFEKHARASYDPPAPVRVEAPEP